MVERLLRTAPGPMSRTALSAAGVTLGLALVWLALAPRTADLAAQEYRTRLFARVGLTLWDNAWFGGHHLPGYSLLFPWLAATLGAKAVAIVAATISTTVFAHLARRHLHAHASAASAWFAVGAAAELFIGRLTFALGTALALGALAALSHRRVALGAALAAGCAAASPVAALLLIVCIGAAAPADARRAWPVALVAAVIAGGMAVGFPEGGRQPYPFGAAATATAVALSVRALLHASERMLRRGAALYAAAVAVAYLVPTPMGSNVARLGVLAAGPVLVGARRRDGGRTMACVALAAVAAWQLWAPVTEILKAEGSPATRAAYFAPLLRSLDRFEAARGRVEVVPTSTRWESVYVARRFALARGWETQLDRRYDGLFYRRQLDAGSYRRWLLRTGVRFVAVADAPKERWGRAEDRLVRAGLPYLRLVWRSAHWRLFAFLGSAPMVSGGRLVVLTPDGFVVRTTRPGTAVVKVRWSPYWSSARTDVCLRPTPNGFTAVSASQPGRIAVRATWSLRTAPGREAACAAEAQPPPSGRSR